LVRSIEVHEHMMILMYFRFIHTLWRPQMYLKIRKTKWWVRVNYFLHANYFRHLFKVARYSLKKGNSRFWSVFLENYYLLRNKKYIIEVKRHLNVWNVTAVAYFGFKVI
jgi:hypothetical protein